MSNFLSKEEISYSAGFGAAKDGMYPVPQWCETFRSITENADTSYKYMMELQWYTGYRAAIASMENLLKVKEYAAKLKQ